MMPVKRKLKTVTVLEKLKVIDLSEADANKKRQRSDIARELKISEYKHIANKHQER